MSDGVRETLHRLLGPRKLRWHLIERLINSPEKLSLHELLLLCRLFFALQAVVGLASFVFELRGRSLSFAGFGNLIFPLAGIYYARHDSTGPRAVRWWAAYWLLATVTSFLQALCSLSFRGLTLGARCTLVYGVQWAILARLWCWLNVRHIASVQFYLNIVVSAGNLEALRAATASNVDLLAGRLVSDDKRATSLAKGVEEMIAKRMRDDAAIAATVKKAFQRGNLIVVLVSVEHIDMRKMLELKGKQQKLGRVDTLCASLRRWLPAWLRGDLEALLLAEVSQGLLEDIPQQLTRQMWELGGVNVDVEAKPKEEEADFLLQTMRQLDEEELLLAQAQAQPQALGGEEVWPFFCGYGHAKVRHVPTTQCYPRQVTCGLTPTTT
eukprot:TRINITY_DN4155_c0_g1_i1.p1 TRINITY_DN4155_c0_g1~~TRINITY_DN4155_c0_g1_i1.p1  ORF type:complete len:382 (-),score=68.81 TRINITY_DN4155_c0_g1_i1:50-1195(-)